MSLDTLLQPLSMRRIRRSSLAFPLQLAERFGNPQKAFPVVHVTGTNGKGSVCYKVAKALELSGYRVGLFTSPHLFSFTERIQINSVAISEEELIQKIPLFPETASYFEVATLLALDYFRNQRVDIAVVEVGIGGLLDTTNIVEPILSIITSVALDHQELLGSTLEEIAEQKAGIIRPEVPVVLGPTARQSCILRRAVRVYFANETTHPFYDMQNQEVARCALELLHVDASLEALALRPPCRFEVRGRSIVDVAHNPEGFEKLIRALLWHYPNESFRFVVGFSEDKDFARCLEIILPHAAHIHLCATTRSTSVDPKRMAEVLERLRCRSYSIETDINSVEENRERIVIAGSFYLISKLKRSQISSRLR